MFASLTHQEIVRHLIPNSNSLPTLYKVQSSRLRNAERLDANITHHSIYLLDSFSYRS